MTAWGHPGELKQKADSSWFLLYPDLSYTEFDTAGYPIHYRDRFRRSDNTGSELRYRWFANGSLAGVPQANGKNTTDLHPRGITFTYKKIDGRSTDLVETAEDSTGRAYHYDYDGNGRLVDAWMPGVKLDLAGTTGTAKETYVPELPASALGVDAIETGGEIGEIRDADNEISLQVAWSEQRVGNLTRGSGDDAIITSISPQPDDTWIVTEGLNAPNPTVTTVSFAVDVDDRVQQTTIGQGDDATSTTTIFDRDGRVTETVDPAGVNTTTAVSHRRPPPHHLLARHRHNPPGHDRRAQTRDAAIPLHDLPLLRRHHPRS